MAGELEREALQVLRRAVLAGDPSVDVYLDLRTLHVVTVRDGACQGEHLAEGELDPDEVDRDEERFAEIPVVTTTQEYLWMADFVEDREERRVTSCLDGRKGANARFLKRLASQAPDVVPAWEAFRLARVHELIDDWLAELGVAPAPAPRPSGE